MSKNKEFKIIAGPCSIDNLENFSKTALFLKSHGISYIRGGLFKLRTNPNSFQGLGLQGFEIVKALKKQVDFKFVCEITSEKYLDKFLESVDTIQVGTRNMYNYELLTALGQSKKQILLKRAFSATLKEWLLAAEYIFKGGNSNIILCERGIRTFEPQFRNILDLNSVAFLKQETDFPVFVDPSHGTGDCKLVLPLSKAAQAVGADGLLIEVHPEPSKALSDSKQSLNFLEFEKLLKALQENSKSSNLDLQ